MPLVSKLLQLLCWFLVCEMFTEFKRDTRGVPNRTRSLFGRTTLLASSGGSQVFHYPILTDGMAGYVGFNSRSLRINTCKNLIDLAGSRTW